MQTPLGLALPFLNPSVIHVLIGGTRVGHRDIFRDKAIRGNFSDGQVSEKGDGEIERERSNIPQHGQRDAKRCTKLGALSEKYLRKIPGAVLAREILMFRHSYSPSVTDFVGDLRH